MDLQQAKARFREASRQRDMALHDFVDFCVGFAALLNGAVTLSLLYHSSDISREAEQQTGERMPIWDVLVTSYFRTFIDAEHAALYGTQAMVPATEAERISLLLGSADSLLEEVRLGPEMSRAYAELLSGDTNGMHH